VTASHLSVDREVSGEASGKPVQPILSVRQLTYGYRQDEPIFDGLSFEVLEGEFVALVAPSGIGKTTLFRLLAGLLEPHSGSIQIGTNAALGSETSRRASSRLGRVGYMPQRDCLMPWRTVQDNAAIGLELAGMSRHEARRKVREMLPVFGLEGTAKRYPHELSGGMRQRVSFMRSMLSDAAILLLDEPFSALDAMTRMEMQEWLLSVWEKHRRTVLFITHDVDEALLLSDRVLVANRSPVTELHSITVPLSRPRKYSDTMKPEFIGCKRQILDWLGYGATLGEGG